MRAAGLLCGRPERGQAVGVGHWSWCRGRRRPAWAGRAPLSLLRPCGHMVLRDLREGDAQVSRSLPEAQAFPQRNV